MKRREEEKLIDLAFGEMADEEAIRFESSLRNDPLAVACLSDYRRLQADMALLSHVPEPQISKEMIREAILRRGLRERRFRLGWAYAAVPSLAAVLALGLFLNRATQSKAEASNATISKPITGGARTSKSAGYQFDLQEVATLTAPNQDNAFLANNELDAARSDYSFGSTALASTHARRIRPRPSLNRDPDRDEPISLNDMLAWDSQASDTSETAKPIGQSTANNSGPNAAAASASDDQKIIVVHDSQDRATGAQQATEDNTTANVLVSG